MPNPKNLSFYHRFKADILSGKKTITIRDVKAKDYKANQIVQAVTHEDNRVFSRLEILRIEPVLFDELNDDHAEQENMNLMELKKVIREIYPDLSELFVVGFMVVVEG